MEFEFAISNKSSAFLTVSLFLIYFSRSLSPVLWICIGLEVNHLIAIVEPSLESCFASSNTIHKTLMASPKPSQEQPEASAPEHIRSANIEGPANKTVEKMGGNVEESEEARIERLGRARPEKFRSIWDELGFCFSVVMSQALTVLFPNPFAAGATHSNLTKEYFVSGFIVVLPTVSEQLNIPRASQTWPTAAFSLVVSSFLLIFGRLADMYGGKLVYICGIAWLFIWSIVAANAQNEMMLDFSRALQGLGPAAYLPSSLMLLGSIYRPGPRKNLVFSIYGAMAPLGFYIGIFFAGVTAQFTTWSWFFYIGAILTAITGVVAYFTIPSDTAERKQMKIKMDWLGAVLISAGLILVIFAITDSSHVPNGCRTPYIPTLLVVGVIVLGAAAYVEGWVADMPILPADLFKVKYMTPLVIALLFSYGSLGIFLLYGTFYMSDIMGGTPLQLVAWFTPMVSAFQPVFYGPSNT